MQTILVEMRRAARRLGKYPAFTVTAVLSLALGIGANVAIFSLVRSVLVERASVREPEGLVRVYTSYPGRPHGFFAYPDFEDLRDGTRDVFRELSASVALGGQVDRDGSVEALLGEAVGGNHFSMLGLEPALGRALSAEDDLTPGAHPVLMLSHRYWRRAFAGDPGVVGRTLRVNGVPCVIVGVAPEGYEGSLRGIGAAFFVPTMMYDALAPDSRVILEARDSHRFLVTGRLRASVTPQHVQASVDRMAAQFRSDFGWGPESGFLVLPRSDVIVYPPLDRYIRAGGWLLSAVVALVLLIVCTNLAGFVLSRNLDRRKEVAVHLALGAGRRSMAMQVLSETGLLALGGGLVGTAFAAVSLAALTRTELPVPIPVHFDFAVDLPAVLLGLTLSLLAGLVLGLAPLIHNTRLKLAPALADLSAGGGQSLRRVNLRNLMVATQVAVSLLLLIGAGLFLRSLQQVQAVDPGFGERPAGLLRVSLAAERFAEAEGRGVYSALLDRIAQLPGVEQVGMTHNLQLRKTGRETMEVRVDGVEPPSGRRSLTVDKAFVDPGFFPAAGVPILRGRRFRPDDGPRSQPVCIVSEAMAARFWPGESALGRVVHRDDGPDVRVVGVARDTRVLDLSEAPRPFIYLPFSQSYSPSMAIIARTAMDPERTALEMVSVVRETDPEIIVWEPLTMEQHLAFVLMPARFSAWIMTAVAVLALALACFGLYGIISYSVAQRTREVGIRLSVGASVTAVILTLMKTGMVLVAVGSVAGLATSALLSRAIRGLLFGVPAHDVTAFVGAPLILAVVASVAAFLAARRVGRINPVDALRSE